MNEYYKYLNKNNIKNCDHEKKCVMTGKIVLKKKILLNV